MKRYLIIGGNSGIGAHLKSILLKENNELFTISRSEINENNHYSLNILTDELPDINGNLDGIVYLPGSINLKPFRALKYDEFKNDWEINVYGAIRVLQKYYSNLQKSPNASVILFSTVAVGTGMPYHTSIAAAKGAIEGITKSLAAEWAPKIRVNAIAPSLTDTPLATKLLDTELKRQNAEERHPLKVIGNPEHIAQLASFLLSENASFITGQIIKADGGISSIKS